MTTIEDPRFRIASSEWVYDLFAHAYDYLDPRFKPRRHRKHESLFVDALFESRGQVPDEMHDYLEQALREPEGEFCGRLWVVLKDIDTFSGFGNPFLRGPADHRRSQALEPIREHYHLNQRLNKWASGHVLWKPTLGRIAWLRSIAEGGRGSPRPYRGSYLWREYDALCRASEPEGYRVEFDTIEAEHDPLIAEHGQLEVAFVPLIEQYDEAPFRVIREDAKRAFVQVRLSDEQECLRRTRIALRKADERGTHIVLLPELVASSAVVGEVCQFMESARRIRLVLAGSFGYKTNSQASPVLNIATVVGPGGQILWEQGKKHAYEMQLYEKNNKSLHTICPGKILVEDLEPSGRLEIRDASGVRMAVLVCEDFSQPEPFMELAWKYQVNILLVPTLAGPFYESGFSSDADAASAKFHMVALIANSAGLARREWANSANAKHDVPIAIVSIPYYVRAGNSVRELTAPPVAPRAGEDPTLVSVSIPNSFTEEAPVGA